MKVYALKVFILTALIVLFLFALTSCAGLRDRPDTDVYGDSRRAVESTVAYLPLAGVVLDQLEAESVVDVELAAALRDTGTEVYTALDAALTADDAEPGEAASIRALRAGALEALPALERLLDLLPADNPRAAYYRIGLTTAYVALQVVAQQGP